MFEAGVEDFFLQGCRVGGFDFEPGGSTDLFFVERGFGKFDADRASAGKAEGEHRLIEIRDDFA